jgi:D-3-phosphoglycerate dehydrogenase
MPKVLVTDPIAQEGIDLLSREAEVDVRLRPSPDELRELIPGYEALVVRSDTKVTRPVIEAAERLQVIGRAFDEETVLRAGAAIERAAGFDTRPSRAGRR